MKAAKMGKAHAQYQLGLWFQASHEVALDLQTAAAWMQLAAAAGYTPAKEWLTDYAFDDNANTQANA